MKIYFGDNQFLGVNHSQGKGGGYYAQYKTAVDIAITLRQAWAEGLTDFCFTVTPKTIAAINLVIDDCPFDLHPALPYAQTTNALIAKSGLVGALKAKLPTTNYIQLTTAFLWALFGRYERVVKLIVLSELKGIPLGKIKSVGLLNVATDLLLGIKRYDLLNCFDSVIRDDLKMETMFYTMNFPKLASIMWEQNSSSCALVFNINSDGFRTNPTLDEVITAIDYFGDNNSIGMSLFSGGEFSSVKKTLASVPNLKGVLFGSSKAINIKSNIELIKNEE